jgi:hypothetical protein
MNRTFGYCLSPGEGGPALIRFATYFGYRSLLNDLIPKLQEYFKKLK